MKKFFNGFIKLVKKNIGVSIVCSLVFIFLIFTICYIFFGTGVSVIEENKIKDGTKDIVNYLEDIVDSKSNKIDKYILFALDYSNGTYHKNEMTVENIYKFINEHFNIKITEEEIKNIGITPLLVEHNVVYNIDKNSYKINEVKTNGSTIGETPIKYYKLDKISRINKKKYSATYKVYTISNPFDMLNYYMERNSKVEGKQDENGNYVYDLKDLEPIKNYLSGSSSINDLKKVIDDDIDKYAKVTGKVKVTYVIENDNVLIEKVK